MLYLRVWSGQYTDWITLTPNNPDECDSSEFDEGVCTGFAVPVAKTENFIRDLIALCLKNGVRVFSI